MPKEPESCDRCDALKFQVAQLEAIIAEMRSALRMAVGAFRENWCIDWEHVERLAESPAPARPRQLVGGMDVRITELQATVAGLRRTLLSIVENLVPYAPDSDEGIAVDAARKALDTTPTAYACRVERLVSALESIDREGCLHHVRIAKAALAEWRKI